ncbi:thiamine pyrophosphate-binding protein [Planktotalea arctica]|uniref:thiamine pyrophosphate-binding protein n=1 Tax=Planktotalea arctica TaxID=1481893 RepID=UPI000A170581|nr:thiamine pyrophosphate-binding protein [Planktotalea arctica]
MTQRPLGAQISHMLRARGVDVIFGIPGVHNVEMYRGIEEAGITHVLARHEQGAGFMADGYARATSKPGVAYVITGPGLCNTMTPLGQAYSDSVPVLAISSCLDEISAKRGQLHQMLDQAGAARTVCDWSEEARSASAAYQLIDRAFTEFARARPRSKHVQVPIALAGSMAEGAPQPLPSHAKPQAPHAQLYQAVAMVLAAQKPVFVFGGGAVAGADVVGDLMRMSGAASFTTYAGRGIVPAETPLNFGATLARGDTAAIFAQADLVVAVGTELAEVDLWRSDLGHSCPMIRVDLDPSVLAQGKSGDLLIHGDAEAFLRAMAIAIPARTDDRAPCWDAEMVAASKARWRAETDAERPGIVPICAALRAALPEDTMFFSDMTQFAYVAKEVWDMPRPAHWHHPFGFGTLGYALPAAIGGKIGLGHQSVVAIAGDYGFQYTLQELGVAVELELCLPIILWDNGKLKEIEDSMVRSQIAPNAVIARNPDFCKLAEAYGAASARPASLDDMAAEMKKALTRKGPTLIHITPDILGF